MQGRQNQARCLPFRDTSSASQEHAKWRSSLEKCCLGVRRDEARARQLWEFNVTSCASGVALAYEPGACFARQVPVSALTWAETRPAQSAVVVVAAVGIVEDDIGGREHLRHCECVSWLSQLGSCHLESSSHRTSKGSHCLCQHKPSVHASACYDP